MNKENLIEEINKGIIYSYLFFWGHQQKNILTIDKSCLSQWFPSEFIIDNYIYPTAEHFMMAEKARLFHDNKILEKILVSKTPKEAKKLGRKVSKFEKKKWENRAFEIVVKGNLEKFSQNKSLEKFLINTSPNILVEASPYDEIWGIGIMENDTKAKSPLTWKGKNSLGFALMEVRDLLINKKVISPKKQ